MYSNIHIKSAVRFLRSIAYALLMLNRRTTLVTLGTLIRLFGFCYLVRPPRTNNRRNCRNDSADKLHCNRERLCNLGRFEVLYAIAGKKRRTTNIYRALEIWLARHTHADS